MSELEPGENRAVDVAVVDSNGCVLLIGRWNTGEWALPGGFVEAGESDVDAMVRELFEETGVTVDRTDVRIVSDRMVVDDPRTRLDAWISTVVGVVEPRVRPLARAGDDAQAVCWFPLAPFDGMDVDIYVATGLRMYACHRPLIVAAREAVAR